MKKYSIKLSKKFFKDHPRVGESTNFKIKYLDGYKKHTIRENVAYWSKVVDEVNAGIAFLAIEEWSGVPYYSHPVEIDRLYKLGKQILFMHHVIHEDKTVSINWQIDNRKPYLRFGKTIDYLTLRDLALNDGLEHIDFIRWFFPNAKKERLIEHIIIHFTDLKY